MSTIVNSLCKSSELSLTLGIVSLKKIVTMMIYCYIGIWRGNKLLDINISI